MLSPKTIANISTGTKDSIGPVPMPSSPAPCPSWKIRVTKPSAAPIDSRFRIAALIGMITERKTTSSSSALNSTTTPTKSGSLSATTREKSSLEAVKPPTSTRAPVLLSTAGTTLSRRRLSVSVVAASCGPVRG